MNSPEKQIYRFEDIEVNLALNSLKRGEQEQHLRQKAFQVLIYLLEHRERLVSKNELIEIIWKDTAVTDDALVQCIKEIRRTIGDSSQQPRFIKTIPKSGYRFIGSVENRSDSFDNAEIENEKNDLPVVQVAQEKLPAEKKNSPAFSIPARFNGRNILASISILIAVFSLTSFVSRNEQDSVEIVMPQSADKKSLAVMYFENRSDSAELEWLSEGIADMLITNLSRSPKLNILSRQQFHALLDRNGLSEGGELSLDQSIRIAQKSGATNFITGSFSKAGEKIRLDVQLYDAQNGAFVAAESLIVDKPEQILTEIDLLSLKMAKHLGQTAPENQHLAEVMTDDLEAYRYYSLGVEQAQGFHNKEAIELFEKAIALDPKFAMAHARIGYAYTVTWDLKEKGKPYLEKAYRLSERLSEKDRLSIAAWYAIANFDFPDAIEKFRDLIFKYPLEIEAYQHLARLLRGEGQNEEAVNILKSGLAIDAEAKNLYNGLGNTLSYLGRHDEAVAAHQRYIALAPNEPNAYDSLGTTYQWSGDYESAINNYNHALALNSNFDIAIVHLANAYFQIGRYAEAISLYRRYIENAPSNVERARGYESIAIVYLKKQQYDLAEKAAQEVLRLRKESVWVPYVVALERNDSVAAKQLETRIFVETEISNRGGKSSLRPEFYRRGYIALRNGNSEEAITNFREAIRQSPTTWHIDSYEDCLADAYLKLDRFDEAAAEYERILRLNPNYPLARFHLAQSYERRKMNDKAREHYERFLEIWRNADSDIPEVIIARNFLSNT